MILLTIQIEVKFKTLQENIFAKSLDLSKNWTQGENMPHLHHITNFEDTEKQLFP